MSKEMTFRKCKKGDCVVLFDDLDAVIMEKEDYPNFEKFIEEETDWKEEEKEDERPGEEWMYDKDVNTGLH